MRISSYVVAAVGALGCNSYVTPAKGSSGLQRAIYTVRADGSGNATWCLYNASDSPRRSNRPVR